MNATNAERPPRCLRAQLIRAAGFAVGRLPQRLLLALATVLAWLTAPLQKRRARIAATNIALCFPELDPRERALLLKATLRATVTGVLECLRAWYAPPRALAGLYRVEGLQHVHAARQQGRGVVLLLSHVTTLELGLRLARDAIGEPLTVMKRAHNDACLEAEIDRCRRRRVGPTVDKRHMRGLLSALETGAVVIYAADQDFNFRHVFVPFFGVPAATVTAPSLLAQRSGAPMLPCWFRRDPDGCYTVRFDPPLPGFPSADARADVARYIAAIEAEVRKAPEQYLWVHRRFKTRPAGEPPVY